MLTVKHVHGGYEEIIEAPHGVLFRANRKNDQEPVGGDAPEKTLCVLGRGRADLGDVTAGRALYDGIAYVMNENGRTIGTYLLPPSPNVAAETAA